MRHDRPAAVGEPQKVEVNRDERRVYVTKSLAGSCDGQLYPWTVSAQGIQNSTPEPRAGSPWMKCVFPHGDDSPGRRVHQSRLQAGQRLIGNLLPPQLQVNRWMVTAYAESWRTVVPLSPSVEAVLGDYGWELPRWMASLVKVPCMLRKVDVQRLNRLARRLREIALRASQDGADMPISIGELAVVECVARHPESTITEVVRQTGLAQSRVSKVVRNLESDGVFICSKDENDRRQTRIRLDPEIRRQTFEEFATRPIDHALMRTMPQLSAADVTRATELLSELADLLDDDRYA